MASQSPPAIPLPPLPVQPFRFMDLPTELRLRVYEYALSGPKDVTLRSLMDLQVRKTRHGQRVRPSTSPRIRNTGTLMVSKQVSTEALPVFYDTNRFHYTILPTVPSVHGVLRHFTTHLHFMQHVSIDYMLHTSASDISEVDRLVSTRVRSVIDGCANLRTFTLHLLTVFRNEDLHRSVRAGGQTALQLARLAARLQDPTYCLEWMMLITHGNRRALMDLGRVIASGEGWLVRELDEWPGISIDEYQRVGMEERADDSAAGQKIRMFCLWPALRICVLDRRENVGKAA